MRREKKEVFGKQKGSSAKVFASLKKLVER